MTSRLQKLLTGSGAPLERATALYTRLAGIDLVKSGRFLTATQAAVTVEVQDILNNTKVKRLVRVENSGGAITPDGPGAILDGKTVQYFSPSGKRFATCTQTGETFRLEVYNAFGLEQSISGVPAQPIGDPNLQYVSWLDDEAGFVFVGEKAAKKSTKPWELKPTATSGEVEVAVGKSTWETKDNWGECFPNNSCFTVYCVNIPEGIVVDLICDDFSKLYSSVSPLVISEGSGQTRVLITAVEHAPRRLGIVYCRNRPTKSYTVAVGVANQSPSLLTFLDEFRGIYNARTFGGRIAFFSQAREGSKVVPENFPHNCCASLHVANVADLLHSKESRGVYERTLVVPIIESTPADPDSGFHGLYPPTGNDLFWVKNGNGIVVCSVARSSTKIYLVDVDTKGVGPLSFCSHSKTGQWSVLDSANNNILVHRAHLLEGSSVGIFDVTATEHPGLLRMGSTFPFDELEREYTTEVVRCPDAHDSEAIYTRHIHDEARPTLVIVHGGPHSTDTNGYVPAQMLYLMSGWNLFSINYGGSLGFGHHRIQELMGKVGTNDVDDCVACVESMSSRWDKTKLVVYGGSHGGFLSGHLTGRYPSMFKAAIIRNPVMNIASAHYETDIPDWTLAVCDIREDSVDIAKMFNMSPIVHASAVTAATLLGIGLEDRRVLPLQGKSWYHALKAAKGKPNVRMIEYPDNSHPLDGVHAAADFAIRGLLFAGDALGAK